MWYAHTFSDRQARLYKVLFGGGQTFAPPPPKKIMGGGPTQNIAPRRRSKILGGIQPFFEDGSPPVCAVLEVKIAWRIRRSLGSTKKTAHLRHPDRSHPTRGQTVGFLVAAS